MIDDSELLQRYVSARSEEAFAELVRRHLNLVFRTAARQLGGDTHRAHDVTQMVFTLLARKAGSLTRHPSVVGWIYATTRITVRNKLREERRRYVREQEAQMMNELTKDELSDTEWNRLRPFLDDAMDELSADDREALLLRFFEDRPFSEIGQAMKLSDDAARMRVARALEKLRTRLTRHGITSTTAALGTAIAGEAAVLVPEGVAEVVTGAALAGGAAAGATGVIAFLSSTKIVSAVTAVALVLSTGTALFEINQAREARAKLETEQRAYDAMQVRVRSASEKNRTAGRQQFANLLESISQLPAVTTPSLTTRGSPERLEAGRAFLAAHPEIKAALAREMKVHIASQYFLLYRELGLTDAQVAEFEAIMADDSDEGSQEWMAGIFMDIGPDGRLTVEFQKNSEMTLMAGAGVSREETQRRLREFLGEEGFAKYASRDFTTNDGTLFGDLWPEIASALNFTETPLSAEQSRQLGRVLRAGGEGRYWRAPAEYWGGVRQQAAAFLSEPQLAALKIFQERGEFGSAMTR